MIQTEPNPESTIPKIVNEDKILELTDELFTLYMDGYVQSDYCINFEFYVHNSIFELRFGKDFFVEKNKVISHMTREEIEKFIENVYKNRPINDGLFKSEIIDFNLLPKDLNIQVNTIN